MTDLRAVVGMGSFRLAVAVGLLVIVVSGQAHAQPGWTATDLGTLGGTVSRAFAINDAGHVVGSSETTTGETHALLWKPGEGMRDLGTLGGPFSSAYDINNAGQVVGTSQTSSGASRRFLWTEAGDMVDLVTLGAPPSGAIGAAGINEAGQVVDTAVFQTVFVLTLSNGNVDLITPPGGGVLSADINDFGVVVSWSSSSAFLWTPGGEVIDLGLFGGLRPQLYRINNAGQAVGGVTAGGFPDYRPISWTAAGGFVALDGLPGSVAYSVNDAGQIVGWRYTSGADLQQSRALQWPPGGSPVYVDESPAALATDINEAGQIAGSRDGQAVVWTPNAEQRLESLEAVVDNLGLDDGTSRALSTSLYVAKSILADSRPQNDVAAVNELRAFIRMVEAQRGRRLTDMQADMLAESAMRAIGALLA